MAEWTGGLAGAAAAPTKSSALLSSALYKPAKRSHGLIGATMAIQRQIPESVTESSVL